jgi:hypothetical protein
MTLRHNEHAWDGFSVQIIWGAPIRDWHACRMQLCTIGGQVIGYWLPTLIYLGTCPTPMTTTFICGWPKPSASELARGIIDVGGPWTVATRRANMQYTATEVGSPVGCHGCSEVAKGQCGMCQRWLCEVQPSLEGIHAHGLVCQGNRS